MSNPSKESRIPDLGQILGMLALIGLVVSLVLFTSPR